MGTSIKYPAAAASGVASVGSVGSTPAAAGASISGTVLTLQPADATHPGVVTTGAQTFAGDKTITGNTSFTQTLSANAAQPYSGSSFVFYCDVQMIAKFTLNAFGDSSGTPGAATLNKTTGRSTLAAGASSIVITNNYVRVGDVVLVQLETADTTATRLLVTSITNGSFTVSSPVNATGNTTFTWLVIRTS